VQNSTARTHAQFGILNPQINSLLGRVRHNPLVIADRGFPFWPQIEMFDISLIDDVPESPTFFAPFART
jgi:D-ribose pyranose/furanose isomerase RbsD